MLGKLMVKWQRKMVKLAERIKEKEWWRGALRRELRRERERREIENRDRER